MVVAADHVRDLHVPVVHHHAEIVGGVAVGAHDDQVVELGVLEHHVALDQVLDDRAAEFRILEADDGGRAGRRFLLLGAMAAAAVVARLLLAGLLGRAHFVELLLAAVAAIGRALGQHVARDFAVTVVALGLEDRLFVGGQAQPLHALEDGLHGRVGRALAVGVLDAQQVAAAVAARIQPGEQRRAGAADMEVAGGAGGEASGDHGRLGG